MPTYNRKGFSSTKNLNLKQGILRFGGTFTSNPIGASDNALYVNSSDELIYAFQGSTANLSTLSGGAGDTLDAALMSSAV